MKPYLCFEVTIKQHFNVKNKGIYQLSLETLYNFPNINWESLSGTSLQSSTFCDLIFQFNLTQFVYHPTHVKGNILDLVLSNDENLVYNLSIDSSNSLLPILDHFKITFQISSSTPSKSRSQPHYILNYSKANWSNLVLFLLNYDFTPLFSGTDLDST